MEKDPIQQLLDKNCTEDILLYNEEGESCLFEQIAVIPRAGTIHAILRPRFEVPFMAQDEALVFTVEDSEWGKTLVLEQDDETVDLVFAEYYRLWQAHGEDDGN